MTRYVPRNAWAECHFYAAEARRTRERRQRLVRSAGVAFWLVGVPLVVVTYPWLARLLAARFGLHL